MEATATMTKTQIIQKNFEHFKNRNIKALLNDLNDDIQWSAPGPKEIPWAGEREGKEAVREFFNTIYENQ